MEDNALLIVLMNTVVMVVSLILGGGSVLVIVGRIKDDPALLTNIERIILETVPADVVREINRGATIVTELGETIESVTDGEPNE